MTTIYSLWIKGMLEPVNHLCIRSAEAWNHKLIIYSYEDLKDSNNRKQLHSVDCEVRDAREIIPESKIFFYDKLDKKFSFGGIAERLKSEMLYKLGGWHVDLDVTFLNGFETFKEEYVLRPHRMGCVGNIIRAPKESLLADYYRNWTATITKDNEEFEKSFLGLNMAVVFLRLQKHIVKPEVFGMDENKYFMPLLENGFMYPDAKRKAIHWCGALGHHLNYEPGSYYDGLLKHFGL